MSTTAIEKDVTHGQHKPIKRQTVNRVHAQRIPALQDYLQLSVQHWEAPGASHQEGFCFQWFGSVGTWQYMAGSTP